MRVTEADITSATFSKGKHFVAKKKALSKKASKLRQKFVKKARAARKLKAKRRDTP